MGSACGVEVPQYMWDDSGDGDAPSGDDAPDTAQGAATETGEPGPGADAENLGRSHDNR